MWRIIPIRFWVTLIAVLFSAITILKMLAWKYFFNSDFSSESAASAIPMSASITYIISIFLGKSPRIWELACHVVPQWKTKYHISGEWGGNSRSNYKFIDNSTDGHQDTNGGRNAPTESQNHSSKEADHWEENKLTLHIEQSFLEVKVTSRRPGHSTLGASVLCTTRDSAHYLKFMYLFENDNMKPGVNEDKSWIGACEFRYDSETRKILGRYCTNQRYTAAVPEMNGDTPRLVGPVAGDFSLTRAESLEAKTSNDTTLQDQQTQ